MHDNSYYVPVLLCAGKSYHDRLAGAKADSYGPGVFLGDCPNLQDVDIVPIPLNHSYTNDRHLTHEALIKILQSLPQVSAARTINLLASNNARLTAEEKAIATAKGWTVAN